MKKITIIPSGIFIYLSVYIASIVIPYRDHWYGTWVISLYILFGWIGVIVTRRTHWTVGLCSMWSMISAGSVFLSKTRYDSLGASSAMAMDNVALGSFASLATLLIVFISIRRQDLKHLENCFRTLCVVNSIITLYSWSNGLEMAGMFGNASMNGLMIVLTYPLLIMRPDLISYAGEPLNKLNKYWFEILWDMFCVAVPLLAVFLLDPALPKIGMFLFWIAYIFSHIKVKSKAVIGLLIASIGGIGISYFAILNPTHDEGRFNIWKMAMEFWKQEANPYFGFGLGTAFMWVPMLQDKMQVNPGNYFIWMHNDWLQTLFEQGIIGLSLLVLMFIHLVWVTLRTKEYYILTSLLLYAFTGLFNFPSHLAIHALFGAYLIRRIHEPYVGLQA